MIVAFHHQSLAVVIVMFFIYQCKSKCLNYDAGDQFPQLTDSYCFPLIKWPVSEETFSQYQIHDQTALNNYKKLYQNYYKTGAINADCLGVAKTFFCAHAYPTCSGSQLSIHTMCEWMCDLFQLRCGQNNELFEMACKSYTVSDSQCSFESYEKLIMSGLLVLMILIF